MKGKLVEEIQRHQAEIISALEQLKETNPDDSRLYDELQKRQSEIVRDLEKLKQFDEN